MQNNKEPDLVLGEPDVSAHSLTELHCTKIEFFFEKPSAPTIGRRNIKNRTNDKVLSEFYLEMNLYSKVKD